VSYRGEFTWEPDEDRAQRMRIIGAVALLCAGWAVGFFSGRMSAWIFPVTDTKIVVMQRAPEPAVPSRTAEKPPVPVVAPSPPAPRPSASPETKSVVATQDTPAPASPPPAKTEAGDAGMQFAESEAASKLAQPEDASQKKVTVINPDAAKAKQATKEPARSRDEREPVARDQDRQPDDLDRPSYGYQSSDQSAIAECERRYNSFRRSDGTYQPFNRTTRELCPLLR
jgi:hypothetical protein